MNLSGSFTPVCLYPGVCVCVYEWNTPTFSLGWWRGYWIAFGATAWCGRERTVPPRDIQFIPP